MLSSLDELLGTDATRLYTDADGWCRFLGAIDHSFVGWHRQERRSLGHAQPLCQGVRHAFGRFAKDVARGLRIIRCDWGPQYIADASINEVK